MKQEAMGYPGIEQAGENIFLFVWHGNKFAGNALRDAIEIIVNGVNRQRVDREMMLWIVGGAVFSKSAEGVFGVFLRSLFAGNFHHDDV